MAAGARAARERAQRADRRARRRRLRAARLLRLRHRHPQHRPPRGRRRAVLELPHHGALLTDALVSPHRPQPPQQRHGPGRRPRLGLPRLLRRHPSRQRLPLRDPPRPGLRDVCGGQVASHARRRDAHGRRSQLVAARSWVRPLVRVPRWRDPPVRPHALLRQPLGPTAAHHRRGLPPQRRSRRPRDRVPVRPPQRR